MTLSCAMAPRSLREIFANPADDVVGNFVRSIEEIYSHPKDEICKALDSIVEKDIVEIRKRLYQEFLRVTPIESLKEAKIIKASDPSPVYPNLRKRNKSSTCYEDLYILAMSIIEKTIHKDIFKTISCPNESSNSLTHNNGNNNNNNTNGGPTPLITPAESQLVKEMHEMKRLLLEIRKENKDLKTQLNLINTKVDKQANLIKKLTDSTNPRQAPNLLPSAAIPTPTIPNLTQFDARARAATLGNAEAPPVGTAAPPAQFGDVNFKMNDTRPRSYQSVTVNGRAENASIPPKTSSLGTNNNAVSSMKAIKPTTFSPFNLPKHNQATGWNSSLTNGALHPTNNLPTDVSNNDNSGFQLVPSRRSRKPPVYGTKKSNGSRSMAGEKNVQVFSLFIGGVSNEYSPEDLKEYIKNELNINPVAVSINRVNPKNRSFKVTVPKNNKDDMFKPENWEESIIIKPFRMPKQNNIENGVQQ